MRSVSRSGPPCAYPARIVGPSTPRDSAIASKKPSSMAATSTSPAGMPRQAPASRMRISHSSGRPSVGGKTGSDHLAALPTANIQMRSSWWACSSADRPGRITSAWRVVSLSQLSTLIMQSSPARASSSRSPPGVDSTGLPATVNRARIWPGPGRGDLLGQARHGHVAEHLGRAAHPGLPATEVGDAPLEPRHRQVGDRRDRGTGEHRAALHVEVAGEHVHDVDQPAGQRAELLVAEPDAAVDDRPLGVEQLVREGPDALGRDAGDALDPLGGPVGDERRELVDAVHQVAARDRGRPGPRRTPPARSPAAARRRCRA